MFDLWLELVLLMERILAHLLILRVKSIEIVITLMEEIYHTWSHAVAARVACWTLIDNIICTILWYKLLNISLTLSWLLLTSSRDA